MCSKHAHVHSIVSRLNAGEHIAEVQLKGPSTLREPLQAPVKPVRGRRLPRHAATGVCGAGAGANNCTASSCVLLVAAVRCALCGCACKVKAIHARLLLTGRGRTRWGCATQGA